MSKKHEQRRGQSLVEFVLMVAFVAGLVSSVRVLLLPPLTDSLEAQKNQASRRAWKGGVQDTRSYYRNACGKKGLC